MKLGCSISAKGDFGAVHAENARVATGCAVRPDDGVSGEEAHFHQSSGDVFRHVQPIQNALFTGPEIGQCGAAPVGTPAAAVATQLQHKPSMERERLAVNPNLRLNESDIGCRFLRKSFYRNRVTTKLS
jgi:hypothetical protein